jgi:hypothetical protein
MKHTALLTLLVFFIFTHTAANAEGPVEMDLVDGTVISGKLVSFDNGVYTIDTTTLGTLKIDEANVISLRRKRSATETAPDMSIQSGIRSLQQKMIADKDIMQTITSLLHDPDFQEILQDEALMKEIFAGDLNTLKSNPKIQKLLNKSKVEEIGKGLEP